ncbi:hypothetical protein TeGR_g8938 [Tetraparma gracilis]|uniref:Uncharacterized protein n=1 Tax=Tetraparma gracilis TaxID=2962635 RepID=A0ABQ6M3Z4_9STRA|nr:hypothetical protein TeGR_g8938 [Tetraparma gracilis]
MSTKCLILKDQGNMLKWCGAGYPTLAFGVRKSCLSYTIGIFRSENKEGKMSTEAMVKAVKALSFGISVVVLLGNIMLLYLSQDLKYAAIASIFSIFTETAGKAYVVKSTQALIDKHMKPGVQRGSTATAAALLNAVNMAANEGGVNHALTMAGGGEAAEEVGDDGEKKDEKMTPEFWIEILAMLAIRWSQEIIVEKSCIIYGAVATMFIDAVKSPHSLFVQLQLLAIFYGCEIFADLLFVFVLDGQFSVPFLRIPQPSVRSKQFWKDAAQGVIPLLSCLFPIIYAHHSVTQWIGDGGGAGGDAG